MGGTLLTETIEGGLHGLLVEHSVTFLQTPVSPSPAPFPRGRGTPGQNPGRNQYFSVRALVARGEASIEMAFQLLLESGEALGGLGQ